MNNLEKVISVWDNLDDFFAQNKFNSYTDMYKALIKFDDKKKSSAIDYIIERIHEDKNSSSNINKVSEIYEKMEKIEILLSNNSEIETTDLDKILSRVSTKASSNSEEITDEMLDSLMPYVNSKDLTKTKKEKFSFDEIIESFGYIGSAIIPRRNKYVSISCSDIGDDYIIYRGEITKIELSRILELEQKSNDLKLFHIDTYLALESMSNYQILKNPTLVISNKYFKRDGEKITLEFGNDKYELSCQSFYTGNVNECYVSNDVDNGLSYIIGNIKHKQLNTKMLVVMI